MDVKIDVSENVRFVDKLSVLGVATDNKSYKKNVCLYPRAKRRIVKYSSKVDKIHAILLYELVRDELSQYSSITICCDVSRNKLRNNLRKLFKENSRWRDMESAGKIKICPVKKSYVDKYVKKVRKNNEERGSEIKYSHWLYF